MTEQPPSLFDVDDASRPLADRLRPHSLSDVVGQDHLLAADAPVGRMVGANRLVSMVLWGPPGCGKTTIARLLAEQTNLAFEPLSATFSGVADLRRVFQAAQRRRELGQGTLLFVDEIHASTARNKTLFSPLWRMAPSCSSGHHREPQFRTQRCVVVALPGVRPEAPRRHGPQRTRHPGGRVARRAAAA